MVTIRQIAKCAGVSTATVSNVIHGKVNKVSPSTIARIQRLIDEMGYVREQGQTVSRSRSSRMVAVIIHFHRSFEDTALSDPFYGVITGSIEEELRQRRCVMMLYTSQDVEDIIQMLAVWDVDGVIAISFSNADCKKIYNMFQKPMITIDAYGEDDEVSSIPNIALDDEQGGYLMARHLVELGYENILMGGVDDYGIDRCRWHGMQRACADTLFLKEKKKLNYIRLGDTLEARKSRYQEIAKQVPFKRKTAIFFSSDSLAMEAICFWTEQGIRIPQDFGVAGFDNSSNAVHFSIPRLTTIHQDVRQKGVIAVVERVTALRDPEYKPNSHRLPVCLVSRQSV